VGREWGEKIFSTIPKEKGAATEGKFSKTSGEWKINLDF
jgi:hypothetical protein